jgi:tetratricopeptide (TPR) repeat protein
MKTAYNVFPALLICLALIACNGNNNETESQTISETIPVIATLQGTSTFVPTLTPARTITPAIEPTTGVEITSSQSDAEVYCPSEIEAARDSYNSALALEEIEGNVEEAIELYLDAIELDPTYCDAMENLGLILRGLGNIDEAIYWYLQSIEIYPNGVAAHQNLASAYFHKGDFDNALNTYMILVEIDPENPEGYFGMGNIYLALDDPASAIPQLEHAEKLYEGLSSPYLSDSRYLLGVAHMFIADCGGAIEYFELISIEFEDHAYYNAYLGSCYLDPSIDNIELARRHMLKAQLLGLQLPDELVNQIAE